MSQKQEVSSPIDAYKSIIDQLVLETSQGVPERLVRQEAIFSKAPSEVAFNAFVQSLSVEQRETLANMLHAERTGAIHDVLAVFSWWLLAGGLGFTFRGKPMPVDLSGVGLHGDYVGRQDGWEWPE